MKDIDTRKAIQALRKLCRNHGIELSTVGGKGSHVALVFRDPETGKAISFTVGGHGTISPGVQRKSIAHVETMKNILAVAQLAATVLKIIKDVFLGS